VFLAVAGAAGRLQPPADPRFWWAVAWVVVLSSFGGYGAYLLVLRRSGALQASTLLYLTPPTTMLWAYLMFGEVPSPLAVPGVGLCALGVALTLGSPCKVGNAGQAGPPPDGTTIVPGGQACALGRHRWGFCAGTAAGQDSRVLVPAGPRLSGRRRRVSGQDQGVFANTGAWGRPAARKSGYPKFR
jgi:EamA-like transporter family